MRKLTMAILITGLATVPGCGSDSSDNPVAVASSAIAAASAATIADFNGDGTPDIAALHASSVAIYDGGTMNLLATYDAPPGTVDIAAGDMDGNGSMDLVAAGSGLDVITSGGTRNIVSGVELSTVQTLDVDGDRIRDIFASGKATSLLLRGIGAANYETPVAFAGNVRHAAADFNGDGDEDLVLAAGSSIDICTWNAMGSVLTLTITGATIADVATADVNADGNSDIVAGFDGGAVIFYGDGALGFSPAAVGATSPAMANLGGTASGVAMTTSQVSHVEAADVDGDGSLDIACATTEPAIETRLATGASGPKHALAAQTLDLESADLNGDGYDDLIVVTGTMSILYGRP